ncbi:MAG: hypothetical protein L0271_04975 [Gemmatimonadetes bacterium]|nr:hypothetical protein [Gemmatimonadota bacterium]
MRFAFLGWASLWADEAETFRAAAFDGPLWENHGLDLHPLSYNALYRWLDGWVTLNDWTFRLPSAIASTLALALWPICLRQLGFDAPLRRWCTALLAVFPIDIMYAQEARAYAFAHLLGVAVLTAYAWARSRSSIMRWIALAMLTALCCHVDGIGLAVPGVLLLLSVVQRGGVERRRLMSALLIGIAAATPYYTCRVYHMVNAASVDDPGNEPVTVEQLVAVGLDYSPFGIARGKIPIWPPRWLRLVMTAGVMAGGAWSWARRRRGAPILALDAFVMVLAGGVLLWAPRELQLGILVMALAASAFAVRGWCPRNVYVVFVALAVVPSAGYILLCLLGGFPLWSRFLLVTLPGVVPLIALGTLRLSRPLPWVTYALLVAVPAAHALIWLTSPRRRPDHRTLADVTVSRIEPGDGFLHEKVYDYKLFGFGPLRAYAWREGRDLEPECLHEYRVAVDEPRAIIRLDDPQHWPSAEAVDAVIAFVKSRPSGRVWTLSGQLAGRRTLDLSPVCTPLESWAYYRAEATLWSCASPTSSPASSGPILPR